MDYTETQLKRINGYEGVIVNVSVDQVRLHDGRVVLREVVDHPGGVAVLPVDSEGFAYCVRQFRYPFRKHLLEVPAGKLERGEDARESAIRELSEETGFSAGTLVHLGRIYSSPGFSNEVLHMFLALNLTAGAAHLDQNEFLDVQRISLSELTERIMADEISDGKTVIIVLKALKYLETKGFLPSLGR